eukprot:TRINITY_DN7672_c2_g2_i2.p1 TRINITY_DN7672_c2_g2~~TRINITY_DN7672_c2_g2_i2.p1  ORF type:complete len:144 (-),score=30.66 TRINITY_DN7672_c2_g2_i2:84-515(-)
MKSNVFLLLVIVLFSVFVSTASAGKRFTRFRAVEDVEDDPVDPSESIDNDPSSGENGDGDDDKDKSIFDNIYIWIFLGACLLVIVILVSALLIKSFCCEKKKNLGRYVGLKSEKQTFDHGSETDKQRRKMKEKYGIGAKSSNV